MDVEYSPQTLQYLPDFVVEDSTRCCGSKVQYLHPMQALVGLEHGFLLGALVDWQLVECQTHVEFGENLGFLEVVADL